jgi:putative SOS response-associated peptidase YedK
MCYDIKYLTKRQERYEKRFKKDKRDLSKLTNKLFRDDNQPGTPVFHTSGFEHCDVPVITNDQPNQVQFYSWGLIPYWTKNSFDATNISNKTLNARFEEYNTPLI